MSKSPTLTVGSGPPATLSDNSTLELELAAQLAVVLGPAYRVHDKLGSGGFGSVYRAVHSNTGQDVAVKVLRVQANWTPLVAQNQITRFEREAALCAALRHPNIVRLIDRGHSKLLSGPMQGTGAGFYYAIYEYVPGETLRQLLDRQQQLSVERTAELLGQVLDALATAHAAGVVHRDLKPANIMVVSTGPSTHVKVLDFGISTLTIEARDTAFHSVTRSHELVGTPQYCAPEQLRGDVPTPRTDFYAWGLVFLECLTGRPAISGSTLAEIYHQHLSPMDVPIPPALVGHPLGDFLRRMLRKNPGERASDAAALYAEFRRLPVGDLVGAIGGPDELPSRRGDSGTAASEPGLLRRPLTAVACTLRLIPTRDQAAEPEVLDPILSDQLRLCRDALVRYGGTLAGELGDALVVLFGYPAALDTDARRALRTVLELAEDIRRRSERLRVTHQLELQFRIGMHTGLALVSRGQMPTGMTLTVALNLAAAAPADSIWVSPEVRRLLAPLAEIEAGGQAAVCGESQPLNVGSLLGERRGEASALGVTLGGADSFVGRRSELAQLREHLQRSDRNTTPHAALILGEAGIGKSRLVREFLGGARASGHTVLEFRCLSEHRNTALAPVLPVLRRLLGLRDTPAAAQTDALSSALRVHGLDPSRFLAILCHWMSLPLPEGYVPVQLAPARQRELLLEAMVGMFSQPIDDRRVVLLFEDLHWADPTTLDLVGRMLVCDSRMPPFLVGTGRPEFTTDFRSPKVTRVSLDRLSPLDAEHVVRQIWGPSDPLPNAVLAAIVSRADGIPLFIAELTRMVLERGRGQVNIDAIPITLRDSLASRLDQLGELRGVAQVAAAIGREFDGSLLSAVAEEDAHQVDEAIEKLVAANLIYRRRRVIGSAYVFRHALIRDAAYDSMPRERRRRVHAAIAAALESQLGGATAGKTAELAYHHAAAGAYEAAVRYGLAAAQASLDRSSNAEAMAQTKQVSAWLGELPADQQVEAELRLRGINLQALMSAQGWASAEVRELGEATRALLPRSKTREHTITTLFALFMHYYVASERVPCQRVVDELWDYAEAFDDPAMKAVAATARGVNLHAGGHYVESSIWLEKALSLYDPARGKSQASLIGMDCRVWSKALLSQCLFNFGHISRGIALGQEAIDWAREIRHTPSLALAILYLSQIWQMCGDKEQVRQYTDELLQTAKTYGLPAFEGYGATVAAWVGDNSAAVQGIISVLRQLNCNLVLTYYGSFVADIEAEAGRIPAAIAQVDHWLATCEQNQEFFFDAELWRRRGLYELRLPQPQHATAREALKRACTLAHERGIHRVEASAIQDLLQAFPDEQELAPRLAQLLSAYPELSHVPRPIRALS